MTNQHRTQAFELACQISLETCPTKKKHLVTLWRIQMTQYMEACKIARDANV